MHELSVGQAIAETVSDRAAGRVVRLVTVRIGHLRQIVPDSLMFSWEVITEGTELAGCQLVVEHVPAVVVCGVCGARTSLDLPVLVCGPCGSSDVELVSGEEFQLVSMDILEEVR